MLMDVKSSTDVELGQSDGAAGRAPVCKPVNNRTPPCVQVNFAYKEAGERKQALVKLRLCPKHALQLNHKQNHKLIKKRKREQQDGQMVQSKRALQSDNDNSSGSPNKESAEKDAGVKAAQKKNNDVFEGLFD